MNFPPASQQLRGQTTADITATGDQNRRRGHQKTPIGKAQTSAGNGRAASNAGKKETLLLLLTRITCNNARHFCSRPHEAWKNINRLFLSGPASMTRNQFPASPTKRPRAWSAVAALLLSLMLAPTAAFADAQAPATPAAAAAPRRPIMPRLPSTPAATDPAQAVRQHCRRRS